MRYGTGKSTVIAAVLDVAAEQRGIAPLDPLRVARLGERNEIGEEIDFLARPDAGDR